MVRVASDDSFPYLFRGLAHFDKKEDTQAQADLSQAIKLSPNLTTALYHRGLVFRRNAQPDAAVDDFLAAIKIAPREERSYQLLTDTLSIDKKDNARAVKVLTELAQQIPNNALALSQRGRVYFLMDQIELAMQDMNAALKVDSKHALSYDVRGDILLARRDYQGALNDYIEASNLDSKNPQYHVDVGVAFMKMDRHAESIKAFDNAIKLNSRFAPAYLQRAIAQYVLGNESQSQSDVAKAKELQPRFKDLDVKRRLTRYLRITNTTEETLEVSVHYWTKTVTGEWSWFPKAPGEGEPAVFKVEPKRTVFLIHKDVRVHAEKVRIWAKGMKSGKTADKFVKEDLYLVAKPGYVAADGEIYDYTFGP
jgi:tetratricopeptide (TPR) repeat protein